MYCSMDKNQTAGEDNSSQTKNVSREGEWHSTVVVLFVQHIDNYAYRKSVFIYIYADVFKCVRVWQEI